MPGRLTARRQQARVQAENRARFDTETGLLLPAVRAALGTYLAALNRRVDQSAFGLAAPPPVLVAAGPIAQPAGSDPHQFTTGHAEQLQAVFDHAAPEWSAAMQTSLMPGIKAMLGRIPIPSDHPDVITAAESWRSEWLAERTQILVGVPDTVTASIRAELDRLATEQGTSVFDAKNAITDLLSPDRLDWEALRIARTECLPGDAVVTAANAHTLYRRWYSGKWIEVETDSGRKVAGTPNHPVLTTRGWVGLGQLTEDDRLICHGASVEKSGAPGDVDVEHPPSPIAEVFEAAAAVVVGERARTGQPDFHGDGMDGYVDVLAPDRVLRVGNFTPVEQGGCDRVLAPADVSAVLFAAASAPYGARLTVDQRARLRRAANGYAGLLHDAPYHPASDAVLGGKGVGGLAVGIAGGNLLGGKVESGAGGAEPASVLGACSFGVSPHRSVLKDDPVDYGGRGASSPTGQTDAGTAQVHIEHVRLVNVTTFGGHVYNLSTTDGYFAINGVYTGNTVAANNNGMLASWRSLIGTMGAGATATKTWIGGQRPTHSAVSGTTIGIDEKFHVGDSEMDGPGDGAGGPGEVINCVVGSTRVEMPGLRAVTRRWFEGDVITLRTASGNELTVTPNHPVLRADGRWVAAETVQEGDHLISGALSGLAAGAPDVNARPPEIAEVYRAAHLASPPKRVALAAPDFHGDGTDGEVEVVPVDRRLLIDGEAATEQQIAEFGLALADRAATAVGGVHGSLVPVRAPATVVHRGGTGTTTGSVSSRSARPALSNGNLSHPDQHGIGRATGVYPGEKKPPADSGPGQTVGGGESLLRLSGAVAGSHLGIGHDAPGCDRRPHLSGSEDCLPHAVDTGAGVSGDLLQTFTGTVATDQVVLVDNFAFSGHVYNLDTGHGWYFGGGIAQRNCACSLSFEIDDAPKGSDGASQTADMTAAATPDDEHPTPDAADTPNTGACLMAYLTAEDANRLAVPGGEPAENLHVTLAYLDRPASEFTPEEQAEIDAAFAAAWVGPVTADAFGTALLNPDSEERDPCAVLLVQSDDLCNARDAMLAALDTVPIGSPVGLDDTFPIWIPHTAIAYNAADASVIAPGSTGPLVYDRLVMAWGPDQHDLTNPTDTEPEPDPEPVQALTAATQEQPMTAPTDTPAPAVDPAAPAETGPTWSGPLALLGVKSSDGRKLSPTGTVRPLPLPLNWQHKSAQGHDGSSVVGRILTAEIRDGMIWGTGDWLPGWNEDVDKARQQVDSGLGLVSVDTAPGVVSFEDTGGNPIDPSTYTGDMDNIVVLFDEWELGGATIVNFPAFADARIATDPGTETDDDLAGGPHIMPGQIETFAGENPAAATVSDDGTTVTLTDGTKVGVGDPVTFPGEDGADTAGTITSIDPAGLTVTVTLTPDGDADVDDQAEPQTVTIPISDLTAAGAPIDGTPDAATFSAEDVDVLMASSAAHPYPAAAFAKRELLGPTPLTLNRETGEVYGHFAQWGECHLGKLAQDGVCTTAPQSAVGYDYFHLGEVITDAGPLPVGKITVGGGHAGPRVGFRGAVEHYDRTCAQVAVVRAYDDPYGGQFTGMLIPGVSEEKVEEMMRAGQLSGDWRMVKGNLELVAALAVNVPGFPVKRPTPRFGMIGGRQVSLVAAGVVVPEENTDVVLPSGQTLPREDWDALVAAAFTTFQQHTAAARAPEPAVQALPVVDQLALRRATARLRLLDTEAV